jgi:chromosome segregation ATPase
VYVSGFDYLYAMEKIQELEQKLRDALIRNRELASKNTFLLSDNRQLESNNHQLEANINRLQSKLTKLSDELLYLRRTLFGRSSERYVKEDPNQLKLDFEGRLIKTAGTTGSLCAPI